MHHNVSFHIAKAEWRKLFYSPIAWLLLILFVIQAGITLMDWFSIYSKHTHEELWKSLSNESYWYFFEQIQAYIYLYVPLLTMGLMSEELSSGTINLMYAAPVSNRQIVWGKFLSIAAYGMLLCLILLADVTLGIGAIRNFELDMALVGILGIFLLFCTYASIGLFMSSLISYQLIAAVGTFSLFAALNIINPMGIKYAFLQDISYWLSINGRASTFSNGLLTTEGIIYFLTLTTLFLVLTVFRLNATRQKISVLNTLGKSLLAIGISCLIGYFSAQPSFCGYWDATSRKVNTLHPTFQKILEKIPEDATITLYANILENGENYLSPSQTLIDKHETFQRFLRFKPNINFQYIGFFDNVLDGAISSMKSEDSLRNQIKKNAKHFRHVDTSQLLSPSQIHKVVDLTPEENRSVRQLSLPNGRNSWLRFFHGAQPYSIEPAIAIAFKRLIVPSPIIGFTTESRSFDKMKNGFRHVFSKKENYYSFVNMGFDFCQLSLSMPIAENISTIVLADLPSPLTSTQEKHLQEYIDRGDNLIILAEPHNRQIMNSLLQKFGFKMGDGILVQKSQRGENVFIEDQITTFFTPQAASLSLFFNTQKDNIVSATRMDGCAPLILLEEKGFCITPLLQTDSSNTWNELQQKFITEEYNVEYNPEKGEKQKSFLTAVALTRKVKDKTQKVLLTGDADMFSNLTENWYSPVYGNTIFLEGIAHWLSDGQYPLDTRTPPIMDNVFNYTENTVRTLKIFHVYVLPALLISTFILLWFRRKVR